MPAPDSSSLPAATMAPPASRALPFADDRIPWRREASFARSAGRVFFSSILVPGGSPLEGRTRVRCRP